MNASKLAVRQKDLESLLKKAGSVKEEFRGYAFFVARAFQNGCDYDLMLAAGIAERSSRMKPLPPGMPEDALALGFVASGAIKVVPFYKQNHPEVKPENLRDMAFWYNDVNSNFDRFLLLLPEERAYKAEAFSVNRAEASSVNDAPGDGIVAVNAQKTSARVILPEEIRVVPAEIPQDYASLKRVLTRILDTPLID